LPIKPEKNNTFKPQGGHEHVVNFFDTLDQHGDKLETVLRCASLAVVDWNVPAAVTALFRPPRNTSRLPPS
jgi:hypothetical protein